ncbi:MAG TPA: cyclic nucleotide-binding domain-containing protein [Gammaproteobacteria bacterium]|nr:cyclic nucleotide-binding domain-containing protein [Gammaproteobacteria bacterium]
MTRSSLNPASLTRLLSFCEHRRYPAKAVILHPGVAADVLYYVVEGSVAASIEDEEGRELVLAYLGVGSFIGETGLFHEQRNRHVWVRSRSRCELAEISYERLRALAKQELAVEYADILFALGAQMALRLRSTSRKIGNLAFLDVSERITGILYDLSYAADAIQHDRGREIFITRQELGRIAGCSREMVGRVLKELQGQGHIDMKGRSITVFHPGEPAVDTPRGPVFSLV